MDRNSVEELCFFNEYGYLNEHKIMDLSLCTKALDRMWQSAPAHLDPNDPSTWKPVPREAASNEPLLVHQGTRLAKLPWDARRSAVNPREPGVWPGVDPHLGVVSSACSKTIHPRKTCGEIGAMN